MTVSRWDARIGAIRALTSFESKKCEKSIDVVKITMYYNSCNEL